MGSGALAVGSYVNVSFNGSPVVFGDSVTVHLSYKSTKNTGLFSSYTVYPFSSWDDVSGGISSFKDSIAGYSDLEKIFWLSVIVMALSAIFAISDCASESVTLTNFGRPAGQPHKISPLTKYVFPTSTLIVIES